MNPSLMIKSLFVCPRSVVPDARGVLEHGGGPRHHAGLRLPPEYSGLGDVLGAGPAQRQPGVEESSLLEDERPALWKADIDSPPRVGTWDTDVVKPLREGSI